MAIKLREVQHSDFDQIKRLFVEIYQKQLFDGFERAFFEHNSLLGYCLIDTLLESQQMVGYFGCFTYNRVVNDVSVKFYNSHTWIVKKSYRKQSLKLLLPYLRLKDGIVTNFSANNKVAQILEQLKFEKIEIKNIIIKSSFTFKSYFNQQKIKSGVLQNELIKWHNPYVGLCLNLKLPNQDGAIELIIKAIDKKPTWVKHINSMSKIFIKRPLITKSYFLYKVHYTSSRELLLKHLDTLNNYLFLKEKVGGLVLPENIITLNQERIQSHYIDNIYVKANYSNMPIIDYLYSEVFYLNIIDK